MDRKMLGDLLAAMRKQTPLVQNITNFVAMQTVANVLLAAGASPAMVFAPEESGDFARSADALVINTGTLTTDRIEGMTVAIEAANSAGKPWVLDPVGVGATHFRRQTVTRLIALNPRIIRGNASEIFTLGGGRPAGRGVDATETGRETERAARALASRTGAVVAATGPVDIVADGQRLLRIRNGHPSMTRVTALGCGLSALCGAFAPAHQDQFLTTTAALTCYAVAGERAAKVSTSPGSFAVAFLDTLASIGPDDVTAAAQIEAT